MSQFVRITLSEMYRMFARRRTYIGYAAFLLFDGLFLFFMNRPNTQRWYRSTLEGAGHAFEDYFSALTIGMMILVATTIILSTIFFALVGGDVVAKEVEDGNLRLILSRPVSRLKLLLSKYVATQLYCLSLVFFIGITSYLSGVILRGWDGGLFVLVPKLNLYTVFSFETGIWRYFLGLWLLSGSMMTVVSVAFFLSCQKIKPAAATIVTISVFFIDFILSRMDALEEFEMWFLNPRMSKWFLAFRDRIPWAELVQNYALLAGISLTLFMLGWLTFERRDLKA